MKIIHSNCAFCGKPVSRRTQARSANVRRHFCNNGCKSQYQRLAKPVSREWLFEQYVTLGRDTTQIAQEVGRDPKSVWNWLKDFGIPTRPRGSDARVHFKKGAPNLFQGKKHTAETRRKLSEIAKADGRVPFNRAIGPPFKGKRGAETPNWKGGTPERQTLYASEEWKRAVSAVKARDKNTCQRCGLVKRPGDGLMFDIHHLVPFECVELRAVVSNLIYFCEPCHYWVHSKDNTEGAFVLPCPSPPKSSQTSSPFTTVTASQL